jgi:hypothetical protein
MKPPSRNSWARKSVGAWSSLLLVACHLTLATGLSGCESVQRKFTRKPKGPRAAPTPVINFQDYSQAMTPLERYRKHYLMFDYWNDDLMDSLKARPLNAKRLRLSSAESLNELTTLKDLVEERIQERIVPLIEHRARINEQIQKGRISAPTAGLMWQELDQQSRTIRRDLFWRRVEDQLRPQEAAVSAQGAAPAPPAPDAAK